MMKSHITKLVYYMTIHNVNDNATVSKELKTVFDVCGLHSKNTNP